jgi:hypothetical protein
MDSPFTIQKSKCSRRSQGRWWGLLRVGKLGRDHHKARVVVLVECSRVTHLLIRNGTLEHQKTVAQIHEGMGIPWIGVHHMSKLVS